MAGGRSVEKSQIRTNTHVMAADRLSLSLLIGAAPGVGRQGQLGRQRLHQPESRVEVSPIPPL